MFEACMLIANTIPICQHKQPFKLEFYIQYDIILNVLHWILEMIGSHFNMQGDELFNSLMPSINSVHFSEIVDHRVT
jgi:hypothetical protein